MKTVVDSSEILTTLRDLPPRYFEQFVADVWQERQGWDTEVSAAGSDKGIDVRGKPPGGGPTTAVQCKRYNKNSKITSSEVQKYASLQLHDGIEGVTVVTTSKFTSNAEEVAEERGVRCIDGDDLVRIVEQYDAYEILDWYIAGKPR